MCRSTWSKRQLYRKALSLLFVSYLVFMFVFMASLEYPYFSKEEDSLSANIYVQTSQLALPTADRNDMPLTHSPRKIKYRTINTTGIHLEDHSQFFENRITKVKFMKPMPLPKPILADNVPLTNLGQFVAIGKEIYAYSAFLDDRKLPIFVRIMTLVPQVASHMFIYCHFNGTGQAQPQRAVQYELSENHRREFGGYIYSCRVPLTVDIQELRFIEVSLNVPGSKIVLPLLPVKPPNHRIKYLDMYPSSLYKTHVTKSGNAQIKNVSLNKKISKSVIDIITLETEYTKNVPLKKWNSELYSTAAITRAPPTHSQLSFAICVPPLFGNISDNSLVEFVELSRILGAQHFIFYNHNVSVPVSHVLRYYSMMNLATILPWSLPNNVNDVWYNGQLLANNDCLYRTMPNFDLVSFNDLDEFIVPHSSARTWTEAFSSLLTEDRCGLSFQSAYYNPDMSGLTKPTLLTPLFTSRTQMYSQTLSKVMLCPWRVFEVGIHHISKQNREEWLPLFVQPEVAYLHHYRYCSENYGMICDNLESDTTIADRYFQKLFRNYIVALQNISIFQRS